MASEGTRGLALTQLIDQLSKAEAFPVRGDTVDVVQTHISVVFLVDEMAYKVKKPVDLGFLDFTTLEKRHHFCNEEVRLNLRGAPDVYVGVLPIVERGGGLAVGGEGEAVEWAVAMRRLPESRTLRSVLARGELDPQLVGDLGRRIASFHAAAESGAHLAEHGGLDTVAFNVRENFAQLEPFIGQSISGRVHELLASSSEAALADNGPLIAQRAKRGLVCDSHGDLHLDHVYSFPDQAPPADFVLVDCIEFNARFRYADPVSDIAFLAMDLRFNGRPDLSQALIESYFEATGDDEGRALTEFYVAYRAVVRGKVESFALLANEIPEEDRRRALLRARPYMLLALSALAKPRERPCLVASIGLPGTGKSWLAKGLERESDFVRVSTDATRKRLAGVPAGKEAAVKLGQEYYSADWNERTYDACLEEAERLLFEGRRVVIDGTFRTDRQRRRVSELAGRWAVPECFFVCDAPPGLVKERLATRERGASDADWAIYRALAPQWEAPGEEAEVEIKSLPTNGTPEHTLASALNHLTSLGLS